MTPDLVDIQTSETQPPNKQTNAVFELTLAGAFWGFGFVATIWALRSMGPLAITGWRFGLAAILGLSFNFCFNRKSLDRKQFMLALFPGLLLTAMLVFQTWGMRYTTATKSAFITTLYVLFVPIFERFLLRRKLPRFHLLFVGIALFGVALICTPAENSNGSWVDGLQGFNIGDALTLGCAVTATLHILYFDHISSRVGSSFVFNNYQSFWAAIIPLAAAYFLEPTPHPNFADSSAYGLIALTIGSTLIAFALQLRAQKHLSPSLASLLFLLESPFSALFAIAFLGEKLTLVQSIGAAVILTGAGLSALRRPVDEAPAS